MNHPTFPGFLDEPCAIREDALQRLMARVPLARRDGMTVPYGVVQGVAVVSIDGPLMQRGGYYADGYDDVVGRVRAALADPEVRAVLLKIHSPGGVAAGAFEAARALRAASTSAGKPMVAYADEMACSGAYALACAASKICLPESGEVGSVGVLSVMVSMKRAFDEQGIDTCVIRSGTRKAEGHPLDALSDEVAAREQAHVDALAGQFFAWVAGARGLTADAVRGLEGDVFLGAAAVTARLADAVCPFDDALRAALSLAPPTAAAAPRITTRTNTMSEKLSAAVLALTGTTDEDKALGKLAAWKDAAGRLPEAEQEITTLRSGAKKSQREELLAQGERDRKITPAQLAAAKEGKGLLASLSDEQLATYLEEAVSHGESPAKAVRQPAALPTSGGAAEVTLTAAEIRLAEQMGNPLDEVLATKRESVRRAQGRS